MIRKRDPTPRQLADAPEARPGLVLRNFEDRSSDEKLEFGSPPRKSPLEVADPKNRSGTYDYFGSISGLFAKTDSQAKVRFEEFFKSPNATPMKDKQISSFTKGGLLNYSSDKKKSSEKPFKLQLDSVRLEIDFPVPSRIALSTKPGEDSRPASSVGEADLNRSLSAQVCAVCGGGASAEALSALCCGAKVCYRCQVRFYNPQIAARGGACPFCVFGQARREEEAWSSV